MNALDTLDVPEAAKYLKCSENTIRTKAAAGKLPCAKFGKQYVFLRGELISLLKAQSNRPSTEKGEIKCQLKSVQNRPITTTVSNTKASLTILQQARKSAKKRNK